jgi:hypothetical protein
VVRHLLTEGGRVTLTVAKPKPAVTRDRYHRYTYQGVTYPGATGQAGILDKPALAHWKSRLTAEAAADLLAELPKMLETVGRAGVVKALTSAADQRSRDAMDAGSAVHAVAEDVVQGKLVALPDGEAGVKAQQVIEWWPSSGWRLRLAEAFVINPTVGYGGTIDLLAYDEEGRTTLADWKTGSGVYHDVRLQLAAYGNAELIAPQDSPVAYPMPAIERYVVLHITERGVFPVDVDVDEQDWEAFRSCIPLSRWQKARNGKIA